MFTITVFDLCAIIAHAEYFFLKINIVQLYFTEVLYAVEDLEYYFVPLQCGNTRWNRHISVCPFLYQLHDYKGHFVFHGKERGQKTTLGARSREGNKEGFT